MARQKMERGFWYRNLVNVRRVHLSMENYRVKAKLPISLAK
jgi:hypothetical protein